MIFFDFHIERWIDAVEDLGCDLDTSQTGGLAGYDVSIPLGFRQGETFRGDITRTYVFLEGEVDNVGCVSFHVP